MTDYPHIDGDFLNLGPECFTNESTEVAGLPDKPHAVISWRGENYYRIDCLPEWWLRKLACEAAGLGSAAVMKEAPHVVMPSEEILEGIDMLIKETQQEQPVKVEYGGSS